MYIMRKRTSNNLFDEMTNLFNDTFNTKSRFLKTDIVEQDNTYMFTVEVPGLSKKDISISFEDGYLTITAQSSTSSDENFIQRERVTESASRSFYVGNIQEEKIKAKLDNGILSVFVPKETKEFECKKCISIE